MHEYAPHVADWNIGDPLWQKTGPNDGKGKGIIGALNYLASKGMNSVYFITYNLDNGDGQDVWMWISPNITDRYRFDVSKLDQWEIVFSHMDSLGIMLHLLTQERENDQALGGAGVTGTTINSNLRKLYYKELVSRYAHHLALLWNMGEENENTDAQRAAFAKYFRDKDPYDNPIAVHTLDNNTATGIPWETFYDGILSDPSYLQYFEMTSLQGVGNTYNSGAVSLRSLSESQGRKWVICGDEQSPDVDDALSNVNSMRKDVLWGNYMGGGGGIEWYFGYQGTFGDLQSEDWSQVDMLWTQTKYALDFFYDNLPFHEMNPDNSLLTAGGGGYCLAKPGEIYAVYLKTGGNNANVSLNITGSDSYTVQWFNPRTGGAFDIGTITNVIANGSSINIGKNPDSDSNDWVILVKKIPVVTPTQTTWTGAIDDDWFTAGNWTDGVPDATLDVIIPDVSPSSFPVIQGPVGTIAELEDLTIESNAQVTISELNNLQLLIHGDLINSGLVLGTGRMCFNGPSHDIVNPLEFNGVLQVKSGSTLNTNGNLRLEDGASLLHGTGTPNGGGTVNGAIKMKRISNAAAQAYTYWSSPILGSNVSLLGNNLYFYETSNATGQSVNGLRAGWVAASGLMIEGKGYISQGSSQVQFNGTPNNGDYTVSVSKNASTTVGWNLIGNPYPSGLDADAFVTANASVIYGSLYFWDDDNSGGTGWSTTDYAVWNLAGSVIQGPNSIQQFDGYVGAGQGFFVEKISNGNGSVTFDNSMRSDNSSSFFKRAPVERLWLSATGPGNHYNEALVAFIGDATDSVDVLYDARKLKGNDKISLYTGIQNEQYAIQAVPLLTADKAITLGIDAGVVGNYTLDLKAIENLDETVGIILEDTYAGTFQDLRINPIYSFNSAVGTFPNRFILHFTPALVIEMNEASCQGDDGIISIVQNGSKFWNYILKNEDGLTLHRRVGFNGLNEFTYLTPGIYLLTLIDENGYSVSKQIKLKGKVPVSADFTVNSLSVLVNEQISFDNLSAGAFAYEWDFGDGAPFFTGMDAVHSYDSPGIYQVTMIAQNSSCSSSKSVDVEVQDVPSGIREELSGNVKIYGFGNSVVVEFEKPYSEDGIFEIYNVLGEKIYQKQLTSSGICRINLDNFSSNWFFARLLVDGQIFEEKILLTK